MATLLLNTYATEDIDGYSYAFLDLTPSLASEIIQRHDWLKVLFADDSSAVSIEYHDCSAVFLNGLPDVIGDTIQDLDNGGDFEETRADVEDFENYAERTECDRMVIGGTGVYWTAYAKHTDVRVETRPIPYDFIRQVAHASVTEQAVA